MEILYKTIQKNMPLPNRQIETIVKEGDPRKFLGFAGCKDMNQVFAVALARFTRVGNEEARQLTLMFQAQYKRFNPDHLLEVDVEGWKGKSSINILKKIDGLTIITFEKPSKDEEPKEKRTEVSKIELEAMVKAILRLQDNQPIKTESLSMVFSEILNLGHDGWNTGNKQFFSDRHWHNKYTTILRAFQELGLIEYKSGKTRLINKDISLQLIL